MKSSSTKAKSTLRIPTTILAILFLVTTLSTLKLYAENQEKDSLNNELETMVLDHIETIEEVQESYVALDTKAKTLDETVKQVQAENEQLAQEKETLTKTKAELEKEVQSLKKQLQTLK